MDIKHIYMMLKMLSKMWHMEFLEPTSYEKAEFTVKAANMRLFGYEGSTTQAFTEDSAHPGKFFPIEQYFAGVNQ